MSLLKNIIQLFIIASLCLSSIAFAELKTYKIKPSHTYPSFEADHQGGLSLWRGKINSSMGTILLDKAAETGSIDATMDMTTIDFGHEGMNASAREIILFTDDYPTAKYTGTLTKFQDGKPTLIEGEMTLMGTTKPLNLTINTFLCRPNTRSNVPGAEVCGADASADFDRSEWGINYALDGGFFPNVKLRITVEADLQLDDPQ